MARDSISTCPVCNEKGKSEWLARVLGETNSRIYNYHRCSRCGLLYQVPMPSDEEIAVFYPDDYAVYRQPTRTQFSLRERKTLKKLGYDGHSSEFPANLFERLRPAKPLRDVIPYVPNGRVLDIGCASGEYLLRLKSIGWQCQGVEFSAKAVAIARAHGLDVFPGGLLDAGFESASFDFVTAHHYIEHVPNPDEIMAEIVRVTKPGGAILIRTPNNEALGRRLFGQYWFPNGVPAHLLLFSEKSLQFLAQKHGLVLSRHYKPIEYKSVLKSLALKSKTYRDDTRFSKLSKWLAKLYIPAAWLSGQGDELFSIYTKPATWALPVKGFPARSATGQQSPGC